MLDLMELTQPWREGGGGGSGRAVPRCRHIGCVMSHGAAGVSCCVRVIGTCVTCVACAGRATMTWRGGGGASESVPRHGRRRSQALEMPFFGQNPPFCGLHALVLWLVTRLRTYFLVLFAMKVVFTTVFF